MPWSLAIEMSVPHNLSRRGKATPRA
eukprot:COSAG01_NODE_43527_length_428_cov_317.544073_1_plen_25_part_01